MTRAESTDLVAKQVRIFEPLIGGWKELGHRALSTSIRVAQHFHLHPRNPQPYPFDKAALDDAVSKETTQAQQLRQKVQDNLATTQEACHPDHINQVLLEATQAVFPKRRQPTASPCQHFLHLWEHRQSLRKARPVGPRGFFLFWKSWSQYHKRTRELRQSNIQQKREYTSKQLQEAERHHRSGNQGGLCKVVRALAPWKPRQRLQLRSEKGQLLDHKAEHNELVEYCKKLYSTEESEGTALTTALQVPDDLTLLEKHFAGTKTGKAVPPNAAPSSTWRCCAGVVASRMQTFIQQQVNAGESLPAGWTNATLALLPKPQKPANRPSNLRAIGLIRPDGKAIAAAIKTKVAQQSAEWLRWVPQFSYQPGRDIADCITRVQQALQHAEISISATRLDRFEKRSRVEEGTYNPKLAPALKGGILFSVDLSKAFDMVNRQQLGRALALAGVESGLINAVLELHKHAQHEVSSGPYRSTIKTTRGIRQGCTLAPTLWTVLSAQLLQDLADRIGEAAFSTFTAFADNQVGHWNIQSPADIGMVEKFITTFLQLLEDYGLQINPEKSKLLVRLQGSNAKSVLKKNTVKINNQKCWRFSGSRKTYHIPIVEELTYLGIVISVRRSSATLTLQHRLAEADKRTSCLRRSIRSRRIIPVHTRLSIWKTCVLSSALHGLHALRLSFADLQKLSQWYHKQIRAVTHTPAHLTKISNQELRSKYSLEHPLQILRQRAENKLSKLRAKTNPDITSTRQALKEWEDIVAHYQQQLSMQETGIKAVDNTAWEQARSCPECGLYFSSIKTVRQHMARKHGIKVAAVEGIQYRAEQHSVGGMPHCRRCGGKFSSMGVLRTHITTNACGWLNRTSQIKDNELAEPDSRTTEKREAAATAPRQSEHEIAETIISTPGKSAPARTQEEISTRDPHTPRVADNQLTNTNHSSIFNSDNKPDSRPEQPREVDHHTDSQSRQDILPQGHQRTEVPASLFEDHAIRTLAGSSSNLLKIAEDQSDRLKHHCLICDHWVVDLHTVKTRIIRTHSIAWHRCNPTIGQSHGVFEKSLKRDSPCPYCGKTVFGAARHLTQCPVIMQVAFLHQLVILEVDLRDEQSGPVNIEAKQAEKLLTDYEEARKSTQVQGLLHKWVLCQADIYDIQTWRRHMKQQHSQLWQQLAGLLKSAALAQPLPRPCPYCKTQYQKTPAVHVGKCLALQQLLAIRACPQGLLEHGWSTFRSGRANTPTLGEPKPNGPRACEKGAEKREWKRGEPHDKESSTAEADNPTATGRGDGRRTPARPTTRIHEHCVAHVGAPRARNTDAGGRPQLRTTPVHEGILHSPAVVSHKPGVESETRRGNLRLPTENSAHDMHSPRTSGKAEESRDRPSSHPESASRVANDGPEMAISGLAHSGPQVDADNSDSHPASGHSENGARAHPGGGQAELRPPISFNKTAEGELPDGVSDHASHVINEAGGSKTAHPLHGAGGSVGHTTHRNADQERTQQAKQNGRGASQTSAYTHNATWQYSGQSDSSPCPSDAPAQQGKSMLR